MWTTWLVRTDGELGRPDAKLAESRVANWVPVHVGDFSLFLCAYWPGEAVLDGAWAPPPVTRVG